MKHFRGLCYVLSSTRFSPQSAIICSLYGGHWRSDDQHNVNLHSYADDSQLYVHCQRRDTARLGHCVDGIGLVRQSCLVFTNVTSALEVFLNVTRYINPRFTYLLT